MAAGIAGDIYSKASSMRLLMHVPLPRGSTRGNWITALRWEKILRRLGHTVNTVDPSEYKSVMTDSYDALIALHARRSAEAISKFRLTAPNTKIIVALTGTDLNIDLDNEAKRLSSVTNSLEVADRILLLEREGLKRLPINMQTKCRVVYQSSSVPKLSRRPAPGFFTISLLAHLREVKDPFLIARAVNLLPNASKARVLHAGEATSPIWQEQALTLTQKNRRYEWLGAIPHHAALQLLADSDVTVLTSEHEGAPSVFSEAAVQGIPIIATRIPASVGLLGPDHPGLFNVGDASALSDLIDRAETDQTFYEDLCAANSDLKTRTAPEAEERSWWQLLDGLDVS